MAMKVDALNLYDERFDAVLSRDERPPLGLGYLQPQAPPKYLALYDMNNKTDRQRKSFIKTVRAELARL
jgi:hypothetical protein